MAIALADRVEYSVPLVTEASSRPTGMVSSPVTSAVVTTSPPDAVEESPPAALTTAQTIATTVGGVDPARKGTVPGMTDITTPMEYTHLGRTGLSVSRLCLGTMNFGPETSEDASHAIMDRALDAGINFFDTANVYGWVKGEGITEQIVGRWFAQGGGRREKTVIATKLYGSMSDWPNDTFLSARNIRHACDASLRRLQTDYIDLYQMHHVDRRTPWDEIWEAFEVLRTQGKVLYFGSSNHAGWHLAKANETAHRRGRFGLVSEQSIYNLLKREVELEVLPACQDYGLGFIPWSPLNGGLLGGIIRKTGSGKRRLEGRAKAALETHRKSIEAYEQLCDDLGEEPADVGLAWLLHQEGVTAPIIGPRTMEQLDGALHALSVRLDEETLGRLDELFPGPGGAAPEAYAW